MKFMTRTPTVLVPISNAFKGGMQLGSEDGLVACGCKVHPVITPGTALPLHTRRVAFHSRTYGCRYARNGSVIDPITHN